MKAMLLAAGKGTRLGSWGRRKPKALMPVLGIPMFNRLTTLLHQGGVRQGAINAHHLGWQLGEHIKKNPPPFPIRLLKERLPLGSGGALMNAAKFWQQDHLLVWNADTFCSFSPHHLQRAHHSSDTLATLLVQQRPSHSYLIIDEHSFLCGLSSKRRQQHRLCCQPQGNTRNLAYNGIAMLHPQLRQFFPKTPQPFDLIDALLAAASDGATIRTLDAQKAFYAAIDSLPRLQQLERTLRLHAKLRLLSTPRTH